MGDLSSNISFIIAKKIRKSPNEIAKISVQRMLEELKTENQDSTKFIKSISYENPGFINFKINNDHFIRNFFNHINKLTEFQFNEKDVNEEKAQVLIEHTSVNPNKSLHVGHLRNAIIGDCLYRILNSIGKDVKVLNYVDDSGVQVADIVVALKYAGFSSEYNDYTYHGFQKFDQYCGNKLYVKINELYLTRPDLVEKRKHVLKELENPNSDIFRFTNDIVTKVLRDQLNTCWRLYCHYDILNFESQIVQSNLWYNTFEMLKAREIIFFEKEGKNAGCWVYKSAIDGDKVLVRSDSTLTYFAKDIPYALWKIGYMENPFEFEVFSSQWNTHTLFKTILNFNKEDKSRLDDSSNIIDFTRVNQTITIIDFRQERLQRILIEILEKIGIDKKKYRYLGYEPVTLSKNTIDMLGIKPTDKKTTQMSGRKGIFIEADSALDNLESRSKDEIKKRNPELEDKEIDKIAKEIAISAIRYFFIKIDLEKMITFDINDSISLDGDTGPYIQYTYARGNKILQKIIDKKNQYYTPNFISNEIFSNNEIELIKYLCKFSLEVINAANNLDPKIVARYLYGLATLFNNFYENSPILKENDEKIKCARLIILKSVLDVMNKCMHLIGISPLQRM